MNHSSLYFDEELDSLFGSPPPSPARGRSPPRETLTPGKEVGPRVTAPSTGVARKNVGTIALPGSHMSCAELPADLPASSSSLPRPTSSHDSLSRVFSGASTSTRKPVVTSRLSTCPVPSRASSAPSAVPSTSASTRRRRTLKAKSATPASPVPPITLPGPNEPTPPNFLRSQSSLFGLAGLVGSVKPAQLRTHVPQSSSIQPPNSHPLRGSTPANPIILDHDSDAPLIGKYSCGQPQVPQHLDRLNPEALRSNVLKSLAKEKNVFPVLESLIKLLGGEPLQCPVNPSSQPFARPYGHGIFNAQLSPLVPPPSSHGGSTTPVIPPPKRRKLKHVPAGAADWDVPFPFAVGEGPEAYHDTWAQNRAKQLVTQLLELIQGATKRATIETAKSGRKSTRGRTRTRSCQPPGSTSVGIVRTGSTEANESLSSSSAGPEYATAGTPNDDVPTVTLDRLLGSLGAPSIVGSSHAPGLSDPEGMAEGGGSTTTCDYEAFEAWLSQLQQFTPAESSTSTPDEDCSSSSSIAPNMHFSHAIQDEAIDPTLLALSRQAVPQPSGDIVMEIPTPPVLMHSPRTSLSSLAEPLTPLSEAFVDAPMVHQDLVQDPLTPQPTEKDHYVRDGAQAPSSSAEPTESPLIPAEKGKGPADKFVVSKTTPSASSRSSPSVVSTSTCTLDKQAILVRVRERRRELVAEIERAKKELWEMSIENAVLVHLTNNTSL